MQSATLEPLWFGKLALGCEQRLSEIDLRGNRPPWSSASFAGEFSNPHSIVYGCRFRGEIIGFGVVHHIRPEAHLLNFAVAQEFRGLGVGRRFLNFIVHSLLADGGETLSLEVRRSNNSAQLLYTSLGFEIVGERRKYSPDDAEDALVMKVPLIIACQSSSSRSADTASTLSNVSNGQGRTPESAAA